MYYIRNNREYVIAMHNIFSIISYMHVLLAQTFKVLLDRIVRSSC